MSTVTDAEKLAELSAFAEKLRPYEKMSLEQLIDRIATLEAAAAQPSPLIAASERILPHSAPFARPVPQAGEVAELVAKLRKPTGERPLDACLRAADLLTAQGAEIERLNKSLDVASDCATDKNRQLAARDARIAELEAALHPFAKIYDPRVMLNMDDLRRARAALAPAGKEVKP